MSSECVDDGRNEIDCDAGFYHITERTLGQACMDKLNSLVHCEKNEYHTRSGQSQFMGRFNPGKPRHGNVQHNNVRLQPPSLGDQVRSGTNISDDFELWLQ